MKRLALVLLLLTLTIYSETTNEHTLSSDNDLRLKVYTKNDVKLIPKNKKLIYIDKNTSKPITGVFAYYNYDGILKTETSYKNGIKDGIYKRYSSQGILDEETSFKNGKKEGSDKRFYKDGSLKYVSNYVEGIEDGLTMWYNKKGILTGETPYKNGKKEGLSKSYTNKGIISREHTYEDDKEHGIVRFYDNGGKLQLEMSYKHGKKHGVKKGYEKNGKLNHEEPYVDGKIHGIRKIYHHKEGLVEEIPFVNGKEHGVHKYLRKGKVTWEASYKNGKLDGYIRDYSNGSISSETLYRDGMPISGFEHDKKGNMIHFKYDKYSNKIILKPKDGKDYKVYEQDVKRGVPPIFAAIQNYLHEKLVEILDSGVDIELKNKFGTTPLSFAIYQNNDTTVKILLDHGANPNVIDGNGNYTPLSQAILNGRESTVNILIRHQYSMDVNFQSSKSETALTVAAKGCKKFKIVRLLLYKGANPDLIDRFGFTSKSGLFRYCKKDANYEKMMKLLDRKDEQFEKTMKMIKGST